MFSDLYQQTVLDHYRRPRNKGRLDDTEPVCRRHPSCGDEVTLSLDVRDGVIHDIAFDGHGCSISQASLSMMTEAVKGLTVDEARELYESFRGMLKGGEADVIELGDMVALSGVARLPVRIPCATLGWETLAAALGWTEAPPEHR